MNAFRLGLLVVSFTAVSNLLATPQTTKVTQAQLDAMDPVERDEIIDNQLFVHFMSILGNFGKIILDPNDTENVATHVAQMIDGIVAVAQTVTKTKRSPQEMDRLVDLIMEHLKAQQNQNAQQ